MQKRGYDRGKGKRKMKEYIFAVHERTPDAIGLSVGQIRRTCKELIRCKDCKWYGDGYLCYNTETLGMKPDDYCSLAEREEE